MGIIVRMRLHFNINTNDFYIFFNFSNEIRSFFYEMVDIYHYYDTDRI
ncbi:Uncharacterised protein [Catenibacterium mitsuokai]|nr:Uncharacterised protein [Catenibacterium mitsuokai]